VETLSRFTTIGDLFSFSVHDVLVIDLESGFF
jgi:hypothetical protein